jgi:hypothetical protein
VLIAGYCHECGDWVYVTADWSCPKGHSAVIVNGWYDTESGESVAPPVGGPVSVEPSTRPESRPVNAGGTRTGFLIDLLSVFSASRAYIAVWGTDTDVAIASNPVDEMWGDGKTGRAEYAAALRVVEVDRVVHFWEQLKQESRGLAPSSAESAYKPEGPEDPASTAASAVAGTVSSEWGYGTTRTVVEEVALRHGFTVRMELTREAAVW